MAEIKRYSMEYYREIAEILEKNDFAHIPANEEIKGTHKFSDSFNKRMQILIDSFDRPRKMSPAVRRILIVAAIILAIIIGTISVGAIKSPIIEFLQSVSPDHTSAQFVDVDSSGNIANDNPTSLEAIYEPTYMTEGYERASVFLSETIRNIEYKNITQGKIIFSQSLLITDLFINTEDEGMEITYVGDIRVYYCYKNGTYRAYWMQNGYSFSLLFCSSLQETVKIIESVAQT